MAAKVKCANCGKAITLEPDANGGERWYHANDTIRCEGGRTSAAPAEKSTAVEEDEYVDETADQEGE